MYNECKAIKEEPHCKGIVQRIGGLVLEPPYNAAERYPLFCCITRKQVIPYSCVKRTMSEMQGGTVQNMHPWVESIYLGAFLFEQAAAPAGKACGDKGLPEIYGEGEKSHESDLQ